LFESFKNAWHYYMCALTDFKAKSTDIEMLKAVVDSTGITDSGIS